MAQIDQKTHEMDANSIKIFEKWVKKCRKMGLLSAKLGDFEFTAPELPKRPKKGMAPQVGSGVEGLVHDETANQPSDSEMLYYSTQSYDIMRETRKESRARNEA